MFIFLRNFRLIFATLLLLCAPAYAQESLPGDACTAGQLNQHKLSGGPELTGEMHLLKCNGTNWIAQMSWKNGRVGIGRPDPQYDLDIAGDLRASPLRSTSSPTQTYISISGHIITARLANREYLRLDGGLNNMAIGASGDSTSPGIIQIGENNALVIDNENARVGIGKSNPATALDINGEVKIGNSGSTSCSATTQGSLRYDTTASCMQLCNGTTWNCLQLTTCADPLPDTITFTDQTNVAVNTLINSNIVQVTGVVGCTVGVYITGQNTPEYRTCSDAACSTIIQDWTTAPSNIQNNQYIQLRVTSSSAGNVSFLANLTIGARSPSWRITTTGDCSAPSPPQGTLCADGTIYVGLTPDGGTKMYTTPCSQGLYWNGVTCAGSAYSVAWSNGATIATGINSPTTGEANTTALAALSNADAPYSAAQICQNLVFGGHSDWYLPSANEATVIASSCTWHPAYPCSSTTNHWMARESSSSLAHVWRFNNSTTTFNKTNVYRFMCARKD